MDVHKMIVCHKLIERKNRTVVAQSHNRKLGWFSGKPRYMNLDIMPQVIPFLDIVVLTFVIMEEGEWDRRSSHHKRGAKTASPA
jgi:hypothetical protein